MQSNQEKLANAIYSNEMDEKRLRILSKKYTSDSHMENLVDFVRTSIVAKANTEFLTIVNNGCFGNFGEASMLYIMEAYNVGIEDLEEFIENNFEYYDENGQWTAQVERFIELSRWHIDKNGHVSAGEYEDEDEEENDGEEEEGDSEPFDYNEIKRQLWDMLDRQMELTGIDLGRIFDFSGDAYEEDFHIEDFIYHFMPFFFSRFSNKVGS